MMIQRMTAWLLCGVLSLSAGGSDAGLKVAEDEPSAPPKASASGRFSLSGSIKPIDRPVTIDGGGFSLHGAVIARERVDDDAAPGFTLRGSVLDIAAPAYAARVRPNTELEAIAITVAPIARDPNGDGVIDTLDLNTVIGALGTAEGGAADVTGDGRGERRRRAGDDRYNHLRRGYGRTLRIPFSGGMTQVRRP